MSNFSAASLSTRTRARRWWVMGTLAVLISVALAAVAVVLALRPRVSPPVTEGAYATTQLSSAGLYRVSFTASEPAIPVNRLHTWTLHVETPDGEPVEDAAIAVDGDMPEHGHGLPTRPQVTQNLGGGDYLVEGLKFQMGGWWVMDFDITAGGQTDRVSFNLRLP